MKSLTRIVQATLIMLASLALSSTAQADTLDFTEIGKTGLLGTTSINLSNATVTSYGKDFYLFGDGAEAGNNGLGGLCAFGGGCDSDMEITFTDKIMDLSFGFDGFQNGDKLFVSAFNDGGHVHSMLIASNMLVDFSTFGVIDRLYISTANGVAYNDFNFTTAAISAVPLPAALPLFGAAMAGLGLLGWRRKKGA